MCGLVKKHSKCALGDSLWVLTETPFVFRRQVSLLTFPSAEGDYIYLTDMLKMCVYANAVLILY